VRLSKCDPTAASRCPMLPSRLCASSKVRWLGLDSQRHEACGPSEPGRPCVLTQTVRPGYRSTIARSACLLAEQRIEQLVALLHTIGHAG
jgi:hypothetical protein